MSRSQSKAAYGRFAHLFVGGVEWLLSQWQELTGGEETDLHSHTAWLMSGEGSPVDSVTPVQQGAVYQDLTNGCTYLAAGVTSADWLGFGNAPGNTGEAGGLLFSQEALRAFLLTGSRDEASAVVYIGSTWEQWNGHGCGLILSFGGSEEAPSQSIQVKTGTTGQFDGMLQDASGNMSMPGTITAANGFIPPTSDPHVVGALWNNAGTPAISAGPPPP